MSLRAIALATMSLGSGGRAAKLEELKRASQLPTTAPQDLMEIFTLRTSVSAPSPFGEDVAVDAFAIAFRRNDVTCEGRAGGALRGAFDISWLARSRAPRGLSTSRPRRRRDPSPRNVHVVAVAHLYGIATS